MLVASTAGSAYGHGLGFDETQPTVIGNRQVSVEATMSPSSIEQVSADGRQQRPVFTVRAHDAGTNSTIAGMDYRVVIERGSDVLLDQQFRSPDGLVVANLVPDAGAQQAEVNGQTNAGRVEVSKDKPVQIRSRIMSDGGLYHFAVTLEKSSTGLALESDRTFDLYVSVSKTQNFAVPVKAGEGGEQENVTMSVKTYYADVTDFSYDPAAGISFSMPFDWSTEYVKQVQLVHMEVQFPKAVKDLQVNGYRGAINGVELSPEAVLIDDYSSENLRIVHFVLNNDKLASLSQRVGGSAGDRMLFALAPAGTPKFPIDILSTTEKYLWQLSWGPEVIETGAETTFVMNVQDTQTGDLVRNSSFDFVLEKEDGGGGNNGGDVVVYRQHLSSGQGTFSHKYTFSEAGTYRLAAENINGSGESAQLDIVVLQGKATTGSNSANPPQQQPPSGCLIATAAFGSELTPQVQFLRGFRDNYIMDSQAGSAFMGAFNSAYYSFSPQVADYERKQPWLQSAVKTGLYPLFGILLASEKAFSVAPEGEAGALLAGATASSLIGAVYVSPALAAGVIIAAKRNRSKSIGVRPAAVALAVAAGSLAATALLLATGGSSITTTTAAALSVATSAFVASLTAAAALAVASLAGRLILLSSK